MLKGTEGITSRYDTKISVELSSIHCLWGSFWQSNSVNRESLQPKWVISPMKQGDATNEK